MCHSSETRPHTNGRSAAARPGGEFFARPTGPNHRRYEALRGYLLEGLTIEAAAARAGYSTATLRSLVRDFRAGKTGFFLNPRPGPTRAPAKNAAREKIIELRRAGHSRHADHRGAGRHPDPAEPHRRRRRCSTRPASVGCRSARAGSSGPPFRDHPPRAEIARLRRAAGPSPTTKVAGLLLTLPDLVALDLPGTGRRRRLPRHRRDPARSTTCCSLLALKLTGIRRVSHVDDLAADPGAALFAGLTALPKTTALTSYSYRLDHTRQAGAAHRAGQGHDRRRT